jgi:hypothetical protein
LRRKSLVVQKYEFAGFYGEGRFAMGAHIRRSCRVCQEHMTADDLTLNGGEVMGNMRELTQEEILEIMCAPEITDEPEESDFIDSDDNVEADEENFVKNWITKE